MFEFRETPLPGCYEIQPVVRSDSRGRFVKTFHAGLFGSQGLGLQIREEYYSVSAAGVLRGLHFQVPPSDHDKLVFCVSGAVFDAVLDMRKGSPTFGRHATMELSEGKGNMAFVPSGCAHGFYVMAGPATLLYNVTSEYDPARDMGVRWDSAGIPWPATQPSLSERDASFPPFNQFLSPFTFAPPSIPAPRNHGPK